MSDRSLSLPAAEVEKLLAFPNGDLALYYLYVRLRGTDDVQRAARELQRTPQQLETARRQLAFLGLLPGAEAKAPDKPLPPADELPEYTAEELVRRSSEDGRLSHVFREAEQVFGRKLSGADMRTLCGMYDHLALPAEVICELLHYCAEEAASRRQRLSARAVEKEAYRWNDLEVLTLEQAEEHIRAQRARQDAIRRVLPVLGIHDRQPVATEKKYIGAWLDMGFDEDAIALAYDRTVTQIHKFNWNYMDKILLDWHGRRLHTREEIEAGIRRAPRRAQPGTAAQSAGATEEDYVFPDKL